MQPAVFSGRLASRNIPHRIPRVRSFLPKTSPAYICNDCRRNALYFQRRSASSTTEPTSASYPNITPIQFGSYDKHNDKLIRDIFDSHNVYQDFKSGASRKSTGLFQNRYLTSPHGFQTFAAITLNKARRLVQRISNANSTEELQRVIKDLDRLSDLLCRVLDLSDFVRNAHPEKSIVMAADRAYNEVYEYMNVLNTTSALYDSLRRAMTDPEVVKHHGEEERTVARTLLVDFEKSGINLSAASKKKFVQLSNDIARLGPAFAAKEGQEDPLLRFDESKMKGMEPWVASALSKVSYRGQVYFPTHSNISYNALHTVEDESVRHKIYLAHNTSSPRQLDILEALLRKRAELANLVGKESYAIVNLADKMSKTPEAVKTFLTTMMAHTKPLAMKELDQLAALKRRFTGKESPLNPWDRDFYMHRLMAERKSRSRDPDLSSYFSLGTVIQGLSRLFTQLYGVRLVPHETLPGETWNSDVRRLDVVSESDGPVAVVYCDLFQRVGKNPNPAHFTVRCSRAIGEEEIEEELMNEGGSDGMAAARNKDGVLYQLPTIALVCDFATSPGSLVPLLSFTEVSTLFHEMGHAIHSILGRTKFQNVAGTRCPTDFAEFPSVLMEHFARSPQVLGLFARHYKTDEPLPEKLLQDRLMLNGLVERSETYQQLLLSLLDQELHGTAATTPSFNSTSIYNSLEEQHGLLPVVKGTSWQGFFTHLYGYGGFYYSYAFDKAIADNVWKEVFMADPLSREAGERYKNEVLRWGGARDPWKCISRLLKRDELAEGQVVAMQEVGKWGVQL